MILQKRIDELAVLYNKTKNERYKKLWYKLIREAYGSDNTKRWTVSINTSYKENVRRDSFDRKNRLFRVV